MNQKKNKILLALIIGALALTVSCKKQEKARYIFIDGGAHVGESIRNFKRASIYSQHKWEIYAFEANPHLIPEFKEKGKDVLLLNKAIWTEDGWIEFYLGEDTLSSSVVKDKKTGNLSHLPVRVESVNFGQWLKRNFRIKDYVLVKLDIEGAEYEVLDKMLSDGTVDWIDQLYVEFHNVKVNISEEKDRQILAELRKRNLSVNAMTSEVPGDWF